MDGAKAGVTPSLQVRLSLAASAAIIVFALAVGVWSFREAFNDAGELQDAQLKAISLVFGRHGLPLPEQPQRPRRSGSDGEARIVIEPVGAGEGWLFRLPTDIADGYHTITVNGEQWRIFVRTTLRTHTRYAVGQQTGWGDHIAMDTALWTIIPLLLLVPILCGLIYGLTWQALRPVVDLAANVNRRTAVDLSPVQASKSLPIELQPIVAALDAMVARMRNALEAQRRFVSDAAHELRSPIAALSLQVQNLEGSLTETERRERRAALREGLARTSALLEQLLTLAYARAPSDSEHPSFPVAEALRSVIEKLLPLAERKSIELDIVRLESLWVAAREIDLVLVLRNLIDNAIRYSPDGGSVRIQIFRGQDGVQIEIDDHGPGIPAAERAHALEPFRRLAGAGETGSGLGLSIVKEVVERLGGTLVLEDVSAAPPRGLRVRVVLPVASDPARADSRPAAADSMVVEPRGRGAVAQS